MSAVRPVRVRRDPLGRSPSLIGGHVNTACCTGRLQDGALEKSAKAGVLLPQSVKLRRWRSGAVCHKEQLQT